MAEILEEGISPPQMGGAVLGSAGAQAERTARRSNYEATFTSMAKSLVKGAGHVMNDGVPLSESTHSPQILTKSHQAILDLRASAHEGAWQTENVMGRVSPDFWQTREVAGIRSMAGTDSLMRKSMSASLSKSFTAQNLGLSGVPYGLVPFDLLAPSRLIYPVNV